MKIAQLREIKSALDSLSKTPTSLALVIARNLSKINSVISRADEDFQVAQKMLFVKDDKGEPVAYVGDAFGKIVEVDGKEKLFTKGMDLSNGEQPVFKFADVDAATALRKEFADCEHDIQLNTFNLQVLDQAIESGVISAEMLVPLVGNMIPAETD